MLDILVDRLVVKLYINNYGIINIKINYKNKKLKQSNKLKLEINKKLRKYTKSGVFFFNI